MAHGRAAPRLDVTDDLSEWVTKSERRGALKCGERDGAISRRYGSGSGRLNLGGP